MRRKVLAPLVLVLMFVAIMAFAAQAVAQPPAANGCKGINKATTGPGHHPPPNPAEPMPPAAFVPPFGDCPPPP